ncbi:phosphotransferase family protein [Mycolicibacterium setense]|uniref:phosphotransferase family protein n=1 Tax=Mycolicibacterium setense TaxID=431269 RepID=UPI0003A1EC5B|nr:phosphotransferase family protein [Mycolicibacterium setense]KHO19387.1 hypothetical protein QQ25_21960 [Mycolicibacterium setense]MCV7113342.1 phosphotransferase family protein [Mycolicibacterium setense]
MNDEQLVLRLEAWLESRLGGPLTVTVHDRPGSGFSADNVVFSATVGGRTSKHVLRRESAEDSPYPEQAPGIGTGVALQSTVMRALADVLPVATGVEFEPDPSILGVPFLVMDFIDGAVPVEVPPCTTEGFYAVAAPEFRRTVIQSGLDALARLHTAPWRESGLSMLDDGSSPPGAQRQLHLWEAQLRQGLRGRRADVFDRTSEVLHSTMPSASDDVVLLWGDARPGNIIWDRTAGTPLCLTDFEGVAVGERELDLGWWLMADRWMHEGSDVARLDGEPTRAEQVAHYERSAGTSVRELHWYELFAAYRFASTVVSVMNRWEQSGAVPSDHTIWRDNPATELIAAILDEHSQAPA